MEIRYQLAFLGHDSPYKAEILNVLEKHLDLLGASKDYLLLLDRQNFENKYKNNAPFYCLYFVDRTDINSDLKILESLVDDASLILPIIDSLGDIDKLAPPIIRYINGFELSSTNKIEALVGLILEGLGLLRLTRKAFISYRRAESSYVAVQLYEQLERNGFDVYLDTHSIRPSEPFQEELWHRMSDCDLIVLLNTPLFLEGHWTKMELARANAMQIGILQLLWPGIEKEAKGIISDPIQLTEDDFGNSNFTDAKNYLTQPTVDRIVEMAEFVRARSLAARQDNIITEFMKVAKKARIQAELYPEKLIKVVTRAGKEVLIIPAVGIPQSLTYNRSYDTVLKIQKGKDDKAYLLYDDINVRDNWLQHLRWLDNHLPIKGKTVVDAAIWVREL